MVPLLMNRHAGAIESYWTDTSLKNRKPIMQLQAIFISSYVLACLALFLLMEFPVTLGFLQQDTELLPVGDGLVCSRK
jgi:hypothetical protein